MQKIHYQSRFYKIEKGFGNVKKQSIPEIFVILKLPAAGDLSENANMPRQERQSYLHEDYRNWKIISPVQYY